jgi:hypothetical protein
VCHGIQELPNHCAAVKPGERGGQGSCWGRKDESVTGWGARARTLALGAREMELPPPGTGWGRIEDARGSPGLTRFPPDLGKGRHERCVRGSSSPTFSYPSENINKQGLPPSSLLKAALRAADGFQTHIALFKLAGFPNLYSSPSSS